MEQQQWEAELRIRRVAVSLTLAAAAETLHVIADNFDLELIGGYDNLNGIGHCALVAENTARRIRELIAAEQVLTALENQTINSRIARGLPVDESLRTNRT